MSDAVERLAARGMQRLETGDPVLHRLLSREYERQAGSLSMVAASSVADLSVLACEGTALTNTTAEGYPGARFHAGCEVADEIEQLAVERARQAFAARYANVQPHSGTSANQIVMFSLLDPGDTVLGLELDAGGHLSHGARASISGKQFDAVGYGLDAEGWIDYEQVRALAMSRRPKLLICGASSYPRRIDFRRFREIADEAGAYLLADISHVAGLVAAGEHPSPIDEAHFTTTSTYKQLFGPRGGLILMGRDHDAPAPNGEGTLAGMLQKAVFPLFQGTPNLGAVAAKARALHLVSTPRFRELAARIVGDARALAGHLLDRGYRVLSGGSDNHIVLVDVQQRGMSGLVAERALEECGILVNRNRIPGDRRPASVASGMRLGTNTLAFRGMRADEMASCAGLLDRCLSAVAALGDRDYSLDAAARTLVRQEVRRLCERFPLYDDPHLLRTAVA
jgi:glycine hydroxymethyltransferase